ncbi:FG-GAP-like repeat-containing protein, partial [Nostoc sp.]|uniref:FG-GAP-like repeat-containing protein n=1 Tax=Nostoc sp. TaxID=1180 RepID=UPI002FF4D233
TTGQITRINIANDGIEANDTSYSPKISADGLYVTFASNASNLIPNDNNGLEDIFVYDRTTGQITRVSIANDGTEGNGYSYSSSISADGLYVTFASNASNLVPNDNNQKTDIFIYDRTTGQITRVSIANDGTEGNSYSYSPSISGDGRYIAFYSNASNLVPNDNNEKEDIFVYDQTTGQITRVSVDSNGAEANGKSYSPSISGDGRYIAFYSNASNLVPNDNNGKFDTFVYDLIAGQITRVSVDSNGVEANGESFLPSLSGDGRYIAFESNASNLVPNDNNGLEDIFVYDRTATTGVTITPNENLVTTESGGTASFSVVLKSKPTADVIIPISSSHITEGKIAVSQLTFTPENWNVAQTVTITGVDDSLSDRDIIYSIITEPIKSGDSNYNNLNPDDISVTNVDNESIRDGIWGDYNKDGKLDVLSITSSTSRIYQNQNGKWIATSTTLPGATQGSWADYDKDSNLDFLLLSGTQTYIYRNQAGSFTAVNTTLPGATQGAWADYNNDGDLDLLLVGDTQTNVYRNQAGSFTAVNTTLPGATQGSWADYDNDGDLDLLLVGDTQTNVYRNQAGSFTAVNTTLPGA